MPGALDRACVRVASARARACVRLCVRALVAVVVQNSERRRRRGVCLGTRQLAALYQLTGSPRTRGRTSRGHKADRPQSPILPPTLGRLYGCHSQLAAPQHGITPAQAGPDASVHRGVHSLPTVISSKDRPKNANGKTTKRNNKGVA